MKTGDYHSAINDFTKAIDLNPRESDAYLNRGISKVKLGDLDGAIADFTSATDINPYLAFAYYNRSIGFSQKGLFQEALTDAYRAQELDPLDRRYRMLADSLELKIEKPT
jgi:tetratricopeptide (TPR) repeat protein